MFNPRKILPLISEINHLGIDNMSGPNCMNHANCSARCCYTSPDIPKILGQTYIENGWLEAADLKLSDTLYYRLNINSETKRCILYDPAINGCKIHFTYLKPPQCVFYPLREHQNYTSNSQCRMGYDFTLDGAISALMFQKFDDYFALARREFKERHAYPVVEREIRELLEMQLGSCRPSEIEAILNNPAGLSLKRSTQLSYESVDYCNEIPCAFYYEDCPQCCPDFIKECIQDAIDGILRQMDAEDDRDEFRLHILRRDRPKERSIA